MNHLQVQDMAEFELDHSLSQIQRQIYDHIDNVMAHTAQYNDQCPPLDLLCYAVKNIIYPDMAYLQIPYLLDLLCNVESYRQKAHRLARDVLVWHNKYFRDNGQIALTYTEERRIRRVQQEGDDPYFRSLFVKAIFDLCDLDIYLLWISKYSYLLPKRLTEYFPFLKLSDTLSNRLFHQSLSASEKQDLRLVEKRCSDFLKHINAWENKRMNHFKERGLADLMYEESEFFSYKRDFMTAFPNPIDSAELVTRIDKYLTHVQQTVQCLDDILFSDKATDN